ncbi:hypothetical protein SASPL_123957 [Salvia splendens]|uniref:BHLH domain-containing protein n=1 Tax=Salvia splendens TaxID=180675 RepID=A0A8X8XQU6_SALSN|nr:hypothetical protein SASPL_123957 [Salvia splendens]
MAEELISWWNSPRNLFSSSPCSLASNDIGSLGWPTETRSVRSSDESNGSSSLLIQDVHHHQPKLDAWNQPLLGRSEDNYSNFLVDSSMNYRAQMNFSEEDSSMKQTSDSSLLQTLFDTDNSQPYPSLLDDQIQMNSNGFMAIDPSALSNVRPPASHFFPSPHNHTITAKVRKEKLGDRITALQQLVSPFGKTDTASVLHEAIEYIKFLHDQVNAGEKAKDEEGVTKVLKTQGLCLVPISSTFPVAAEATSDFWTPTFTGSFR